MGTHIVWAGRVKAARLKCEMTQFEAAVLLQVQPLTVSRWERGASAPAYWTQKKILEELEATWKANRKEKRK